MSAPGPPGIRSTRGAVGLGHRACTHQRRRQRLESWIVTGLRKAGTPVQGNGSALRPWKVTYEDVKRIQALDLVMKALEDADEDWDRYITLN